MSRLDIINDEISRRTKSISDLKVSNEDLKIVVEQFNKLDEMYRSDEKNSRERLESLYKENRHFSGKWPIVYTSAQTEIFPFFNGLLDTDCNPYFPITKVKDGTFNGLEPLYAPPTKTGAYERDRNYSPTEDVARASALSALQAFPNYQLPDSNETGEWLPANWPDAQAGGVPDPVWVPSETATALLRVELDSWRADIVNIQNDLHNNDTDENDYWQDVLNDIDTVLAEIQVDPEFIRATGNNDPLAWGRTPDFTPGSPEDLARNRLISAADTDIPSHVSDRRAYLEKEANSEEQAFFGIVNLRLHQANGSYVKLRTSKGQKDTNDSLINNNIDSIKTLNLLKVKNS